MVDGTSWQKEQFSKAYLLAVATHAGATIGEWNVDKDGVDVTLRRRQHMVDIQLKCTRAARVVGGDFVFDLDVTTYAKLSDPDRSVPSYLSLVIVPPTLDKWLLHQPEVLLMRCHGYWASMNAGQVPTGASSLAIRLPRQQRLDAAALTRMFEASRRWILDGRGTGAVR